MTNNIPPNWHPDRALEGMQRAIKHAMESFDDAIEEIIMEDSSWPDFADEETQTKWSNLMHGKVREYIRKNF